MIKAYLEAEDIIKLEQSTNNIRDRLLVRLLFHLGCRITEALSLKPEDIDFTLGIVTIQHLKSRIKLNCPQCGNNLGKSHGFCPKCGAEVKETVVKEQEHRRMRSLPLDKQTLELLADYIKRGGAVNQKGRQLIFGINRHRAWQIIKECADKANLPQLINPDTGRNRGISPHRLRDAFAVHAMKLNDSGDGLRLLQEHLGHSRFDTTAKYRKVAGQELKDWYDRLWNTEVKTNGAQT